MKKSEKKTFDKVHMHYDNFMKIFNLYRGKEISDILNLKGDEKILDIGGGTGYLAKYLNTKCKEIYVLDESEDMLSHVKEKENIHKVVCDALDLKINDESMDIVILSDVFHHIKDQNKLMDESFRVLKYGGRVLIHDFDISHKRTKILRCFERVLFGKLYFKTIDEVINILESRFYLTTKKERGYYFILVGEKKGGLNDK
ncbi:class I SAM-dependent methyltransferase [Maledivibacter halophilus]|uniref:Demethylmenaquinone methyltransferase / 2-methoxy-6-polyprenyl-1,4-benzoquinol methylase n=1 Tax=Maledivibacter halophilus TaxID=36842 RepID=A0A1T5J8A6_9FIRM|nr:class I SAM-dependent methyltransferase [Maledivibacter halophilus]SKC47556.1 demethylmenaquinone methyltransferase / 2-methoxy-6-polyprenyl-1,4-benzoquinol methylase [Maledivibacter halophilus]